MKVIIPENTLLWTPKGFCFGKDISYGTEIFIINSNNELKSQHIIDDIEEPEEQLVSSLIFENQVSTVPPYYKIKNQEDFVQIKAIKENDSFNLFDKKIIDHFIQFQNEHAIEYSESSPISAVVAKYLSFCTLSNTENIVQFEQDDEESASKFNLKIQKELKELGGDVHRRLSPKWKNTYSQYYKAPSIQKYKIFYDSEKFYNIRKQNNFLQDKISNIIYSNGISIFSMFVRGLFQNVNPGYEIFSFNRDSAGTYAVLHLPVDSKIRKLLQNTLIFENNFKLSVFENNGLKYLDELRLYFTGLTHTTQKILEIKNHFKKCYEIEIPMGSKLIMDNMIVKPHEITDDERDKLQNEFVDKIEENFDVIRKKITSEQTNITILNFVTINKIIRSSNFKLHVLGKFTQKGTVKESSTRFGNAAKVSGMLNDETGVIQIQLYGEIAIKIKNNDILELINSYSNNGILYNKAGETDIIHEM